MPKQVRFQGQLYTFPDDATDAEIAAALESASPAPEPEGKSLMGFLTNIPRSAGRLVADTVKGVVDIGAAAGESALERSTPADNPRRAAMQDIYGQVIGGIGHDAVMAAPTVVPNAIRGLVQHYKERFVDHPLDTIYEDPVGVVADLVPFGAAKASRIKKITDASTLNKVSNVVEQVGNVINKPIEATAGRVITPVIAKAGEKVKNLGTTLMVKAAKPTVAEMREMPSGRQNISQARRDFVNTLADNKVSLNAKGIDKVQDAIDAHNTIIDDAIAAHGEPYLDVDQAGQVELRLEFPKISLASVEEPLKELKERFSKQVNPTADLEAIEKVRQDFRQSIGFPEGGNVDTFAIPFDQAHEIKKGTYAQLQGKYNELKSADVEAQKALARGLKKQVADRENDVDMSNNKLSELYPTRKALEKIVSRLETSQPFGLREMAGVGGGVSLPFALASGNPALTVGAALPLAWQLARPEVLFPIGKAVYTTGKRANEINPAGIEKGLQAILLQRLLEQAQNRDDEDQE